MAEESSNGFSIFGYEFKKKDKAQQERKVSFVSPERDDGAMVIAAAGGVMAASYVDLESAAKNESELVSKYRDMANQPEIDLAVDDIVNEAVSIAVKFQQSNIYFTLQIIDPRLIGRAYNKLKPTNQTTSDNNVIAYRWIPIDVDPKRPAGVSSSDSELKQAIEIRDIIRDYLLMTNRFKHIITAVSGNGGHILIRIPKDIPNTPQNKDYIKSFIEDLSQRFSTDSVDIDTTVFNPARIWKLYGTKAMKGDEVPENQYREALKHRLSYIDDMGGLI